MMRLLDTSIRIPLINGRMREGRPIDANDLMIASIALSGGVTLVTRNRDEFARVPGLDVEAW